MIYGHLEREHPRTTEAAQVHFKGGKVLITQPLGCLPFARPDNCKENYTHTFSVDKPAHLTIRFLWVFVSDCVKLNQNEYKY